MFSLNVKVFGFMFDNDQGLCQLIWTEFIIHDTKQLAGGKP